jgi:hypothetical protein
MALTNTRQEASFCPHGDIETPRFQCHCLAFLIQPYCLNPTQDGSGELLSGKPDFLPVNCQSRTTRKDLGNFREGNARLGSDVTFTLWSEQNPGLSRVSIEAYLSFNWLCGTTPLNRFKPKEYS